MRLHQSIFWLTTIVLQLHSDLLYAKNLTFSYEPSVVELSGVLETQTFAGPPNYESISGGDKPEKYFYIKLDQEIDISGVKGDSVNSQPERNLRVLQLVILDPNVWDQTHKLGAGAHVVVIGRLFHRHTGHHHSRVLITLDQFKAI